MFLRILCNLSHFSLCQGAYKKLKPQILLLAFLGPNYKYIFTRRSQLKPNIVWNLIISMQSSLDVHWQLELWNQFFPYLKHPNEYEMCCICSMHVYSSALCLEWNDHSDVFFITEQCFLILWCFTYGAIIAICHLDAWSVANLQSFDACNNYYYWCHCTIFKIWTSLCTSTANRRWKQPVHTKAGNFLLVNLWNV